MKLLIVTPYYYPAFVYGGPSKSIALLADALADRSVEVSVYTTNANGKRNLDVDTKLSHRINGTDVYYCNRITNALARYFCSPDLWTLMNRTITSFDVVYICGHWIFPFWAGARSAIRHNIPFVISPRGSFMDWSINQGKAKKMLYLYLIEKRLIEKARYTHVTSSLELKQLTSWPFFPNPVLVPNGIESQTKSPLPDHYWRDKLDVSIEAPISLFVGRFHKMKRVLTMIVAFSKVLKAIPGAQLWLAGSDEDGTLGTARKLVESLSLQRNIRFLGLLDPDLLNAAYLDANLLILLSHRENFGNVVIEAMNQGLPVLLSDEVGIATEVCSKGAGVSVNPDEEELVNTWIKLLGDLDALKSMGETGRNLVKIEYSIEKVATEMHAIFQKAAAGSGEVEA